MGIITVESHENAVLRRNTELVQENELILAKEIVEKLLAALKPHLPAAGLAAPQIGISKAIFIFSYDRDPKHLEVVINPTFVPLEETKTQGWEGCFSTILSKADWKIAHVYRFEKIKVSYLNLKGKRIERILEGFAAKVFQHEYDHLQGIVNIDRDDAVIKSFDSEEEMLQFMKVIKEKDAAHYVDSIRREIHCLVGKIEPLDHEEATHIEFVKNWIESGVEIFRIEKPAIPDIHLVSYFVLVDQRENKVLLTDHKRSGLWLPAGGHVELNEHPQETVKRELLEELGIEADFLLPNPFFLSVARTVGSTAGHTDVSLWYLIKGKTSTLLDYDEREFNQIRWFSPADVPYPRTDPHMSRFMQKLELFKKVISNG